jgi:hypothetical protein
VCCLPRVLLDHVLLLIVVFDVLLVHPRQGLIAHRPMVQLMPHLVQQVLGLRPMPERCGILCLIGQPREAGLGRAPVLVLAIVRAEVINLAVADALGHQVDLLRLYLA